MTGKGGKLFRFFVSCGGGREEREAWRKLSTFLLQPCCAESVDSTEHSKDISHTTRSNTVDYALAAPRCKLSVVLIGHSTWITDNPSGLLAIDVPLKESPVLGVKRHRDGIEYHRDDRVSRVGEPRSFESELPSRIWVRFAPDFRCSRTNSTAAM